MANFAYRVQELEQRSNKLSVDVKKLRTEIKIAHKFTAQFLNTCKKNKINRVAIGVRDENIESAKKWPWDCQGSVFADARGETWPAIWQVVEEMGISCGAGNNGQHQADLSKLIEGKYEYKEGKWVRL